MMEENEVVTFLSEASEVNGLPKGAIVGDNCGGRSFNDNIAAALERRSCSGWQDVDKSGQQWTLIMIER